MGLGVAFSSSSFEDDYDDAKYFEVKALQFGMDESRKCEMEISRLRDEMGEGS